MSLRAALLVCAAKQSLTGRGDCVATAPRDASDKEQERPRNDIPGLRKASR